MRRQVFYILIGVIFCINIVLVGFYFLRKSTPTKKNLATSIPISTLQINFDNNLGLKFDFNEENTIKLLDDVEFTKYGRVYNFTSNSYYSPQILNMLALPLVNSQNNGFTERIKIGKKTVFAYNILQEPDQTTIEMFFDIDYFTSLDKQQINPELNSLIRKVILTLGATAKKQASLAESERKAINTKNAELINLNIVDVQK